MKILLTTRQFGVDVGRLLEAGDVLFLHGDLGSGKTTFAQGVAVGAGVETHLTSPTFTLISESWAVNEDHDPIPFFHLDLYRLESTDEVETIGYRDLLARNPGIVLVEWPERAGESDLPAGLLIQFRFDGEERRLIEIRTIGESERTSALLKNLETIARP